MDCYAAQFEPLPRDTRGVPLEHLVTCVAGLELVESGGKKYICPSVASPPDNGKFTYYNTFINQAAAFQYSRNSVGCFPIGMKGSSTCLVLWMPLFVLDLSVNHTMSNSRCVSPPSFLSSLSGEWIHTSCPHDLRIVTKAPLPVMAANVILVCIKFHSLPR